jgi:hypothetical protein
MTNPETFIDIYREQLRIAIETHPEEYAQCWRIERA